MRVEEVMSKKVETCRPDDTLNRAAQIMWEHDCGVVPVVDGDAHMIGMLTDRDICMAAYTQGRPLSEIAVASACSRNVRTCNPDDSLESAESVMAAAQVRRIAVVGSNGKLCGILSVGDLARHVHAEDRNSDGLSAEQLASIVAAISAAPGNESTNGTSDGSSTDMHSHA